MHVRRQALSIRPDILSPAAMNELQKLCDKVPSFDSGVAMQVIADELGAPWYEVYADLTPEPIAAASLVRGGGVEGERGGEALACGVYAPGGGATRGYQGCRWCGGVLHTFLASPAAHERATRDTPVHAWQLTHSAAAVPMLAWR
jgi:hypothetical protein